MHPPLPVVCFLRFLSFELLRRHPECGDYDRDAVSNNVKGQCHDSYQTAEVE